VFPSPSPSRCPALRLRETIWAIAIMQTVRQGWSQRDSGQVLRSDGVGEGDSVVGEAARATAAGALCGEVRGCDRPGPLALGGSPLGSPWGSDLTHVLAPRIPPDPNRPLATLRQHGGPGPPSPRIWVCRQPVDMEPQARCLLRTGSAGLPSSLVHHPRLRSL